MFLGEETCEFIKGEAAHYMDFHKVCYPISGDSFAACLGIKTIPYSKLSQSGRAMALYTSEDGFLFESRLKLYFNDNSLPERIEMTKLHEIGHYLLDHNSTPNKSEDEKEKEARFFAKYVMAPPPLIHQLEDISEESIRREFGLSFEASHYALEYYYKWKRKFNGIYTDYEIKLLRCWLRTPAHKLKKEAA